LSLESNKLSSLSIGNNQELVDIDVSINNISAQELNNIFQMLPIFSDFFSFAKIYIGGNPGTDSCDVSIATEKNWNVSKIKENKLK